MDSLRLRLFDAGPKSRTRDNESRLAGIRELERTHSCILSRVNWVFTRRDDIVITMTTAWALTLFCYAELTEERREQIGYCLDSIAWLAFFNCEGLSGNRYPVWCRGSVLPFTA